MDEKNTFEILKIFEVIRKRIVIIVVIPILAAVITGFISNYNYKPVYMATETVIVGVDNSNKIDPTKIEFYQEILGTCIQIAKSSAVAQNAAAKINNGTSAAALQGGFNVFPQEGTQMLVMTYTSNDQNDAVKKVQVMAQAVLEEESKLLSNVSLQILDNAKLTGASAKPDKKNSMLAIMAGLAVSIGLAIFLELLNKTIKDEEDVSKYLGIPVVGVIPKY